MLALGGKGYGGFYRPMSSKAVSLTGGVLAGNGRAPARPTTHPADRTAARFWMGKGLSFAVWRVITAVKQREEPAPYEQEHRLLP
jgi:hypothetical protein